MGYEGTQIIEHFRAPAVEWHDAYENRIVHEDLSKHERQHLAFELLVHLQYIK